MMPKAGEVYRHFKGDYYKVITIATHTETEEKMVVYQAMYGERECYVRPLTMFMSDVDHEKYPDVEQEKRFERVENLDQEQISEADFAGQDAIDPLLIEFLDSDTYLEKRNILAALHHKISNEMINTMAAALDIVIEDGELENRYMQLYSCINTREKYEINRN